jgi:signal transduction histidine kinase
MPVQEEERRRIARELHDRTTQHLTALTIQLDTVAASQPDAGAALARAREIASAAGRAVDRLEFPVTNIQVVPRSGRGPTGIRGTGRIPGG